MLVLRASIGLTATAQGLLYLWGKDALGLEGLAVGILFLAAGVSLLIGFITPVSGLLAGLCNLGILLKWIAGPWFNSSGSRLFVLQIVVLAVSLSLLGPGAFSLDARLFGRREIVIPPATRPPEY
ncbi:MAG TPA: hypothetical protein VMU43_13755 [Candidatus Acidoferrum sp.]|nr:hypothetical protein [Candidatus Acidoferrum sp.]